MSDLSPCTAFPLPLTTFERYMLWDDRPQYPMMFMIQMRLSGDVRREAFEEAMGETLARHPMLRATVDPRSRGGPRWVLGGDAKPRIDWSTEATPLECPDGGRFDLTREPGLRTWVRQGPEEVQVLFQVHHSCCDGLGMLQVIGDLLAAYGRRTATEGGLPELEPLDCSQLANRGTFPIEVPENYGRLRALWDTAKEAGKWVGRMPSPLYPPDPGTKLQDAPFPGILVHSFSEQQTQRLRAAGRRHKASLNDLLLRDLFVTCAQWNEQQRPGRPGKWLRINVPQNLRQRHHDRMPAANAMSQAFITRRVADCAEPTALLEGIRAETEFIKRWRLGLYFLGGLNLAEKLPGVLPLGRALLGHRCFATTVLTYVGEFSRRFTAKFPRRSGRVVAGNLVLESLLGVPPLRPGTRAGFGAAIYGGELEIILRCDPLAFRIVHAQRLIRLYVDQLTRTLESAD